MTTPHHLALALAAALLLGACEPADSMPEEPATVGTCPNLARYGGYTYTNRLVTGQACRDYNEAGLNCSQQLELRGDGTATIVVTDIINRGTWAEDASTITTTWPRPADVVESIVFSKQPDTNDLVDEYGTVWTCS